MDLFTRFNRKDIQDRQIDTLIGLAKGISADEKVNRDEADYLVSWLIQNRASTENPIVVNLLEKVAAMLEDDVLDADESAELLSVLQKISGDSSEIGEVGKSTSLPLCDPPPAVTILGKSFLFTGTCAYGTRKQCQAAIAENGGINANSVVKSLDYLVIGTYVTDSWAHETFGRKIEKAITYQQSGVPISIISEKHWVTSSGIT